MVWAWGVPTLSEWAVLSMKTIVVATIGFTVASEGPDGSPIGSTQGQMKATGAARVTLTFFSLVS